LIIIAPVNCTAKIFFINLIEAVPKLSNRWFAFLEQLPIYMKKQAQTANLRFDGSIRPLFQEVVTKLTEFWNNLNLL